MKKILWVPVFWIFAATVFCSPSLQEGDIVFQSQYGNFSKAIQLATHSPYNHMGMVFIRHGKPYVLEAVGPVKFTAWDHWIKNGKQSRFTVKRLKNARQALTPEVLNKMEVLARKYQGKRYSFTFDWSEDRFYCSGLVWRIYHDTTGLELGRFKKLGDFDLSDPLVKKELKKHFGPFVPLNHELISPEDIFESNLLYKVELN